VMELSTLSACLGDRVYRRSQGLYILRRKNVLIFSN